MMKKRIGKSATIVSAICMSLTAQLFAEEAKPEIEALYLAQTHVSKLDDPYFNITGNRPALLKVHVVSRSGLRAPKVTAKISLADESTTLDLKGPEYLPRSFIADPGKIRHTLKDCFSVLIPAQWIQPGLHIDIQAGDQKRHCEIPVRAPNPMTMHMFDIHYFGKDKKNDYPEGFFKELEAKWPVSKLKIQRVRNIAFNELVIPARDSLPHVRVKSKEEYKVKTGQRFDGEQAAALQWVHALSAAGGHYDTAMCYVNIIGVFAGGQAGGFDGVGYIGAKGIAHHELGHALGLPHWGRNTKYPYRGEMHGIPAPRQEVHVGPVWGFDLPSQTFISPFTQRDIGSGERRIPRGVFKYDPMQGGGHGAQDPPFLLNHFSDYSVYQMQRYIEKKLAVQKNGDYYKWNHADGNYTLKVSNENNRGIRYPLETDVEVVSIMAACTLSDKSVSMVYPPIGPYNSNLMLTFDPRDHKQRALAKERKFPPKNGCDFSLRVIQGGKESLYMLPVSGEAGSDPMKRNTLRTVAVNVRASDGDVTRAELLLTPDAETNGLPLVPEILHSWSKNAPLSMPGSGRISAFSTIHKPFYQ